METQNTTPTHFTRYEERTSILSNQQHISGTLDPNSQVGKGTFIEYVVLVTLCDCVKESFNYRYDLTSESFGKINVKSSSLKSYNNVDGWQFRKIPSSYIPDHYICVGLDTEFNEILHVWAIPGKCNLVGDHGINISDSKIGLSKCSKYELDATLFNVVFHCLDITSIPEFCNIGVKNIDLYQSIARDVKKGRGLLNIIGEYGDTIYRSYLKWIKTSNSDRCFNLYDGVIGVAPIDVPLEIHPYSHLIEISAHKYPLYDYNGEYIGYMYNGEYITPKIKPSDFFYKIRDVKYIIQSYTRSDGKVSLDIILKETGLEDLDTVIKKLVRRGDVLPLKNDEFKWVGEFSRIPTIPD